MAAATIRTTYALDAETVERLTQLARHWNLSRSATLRKLIREAEEPALADKLAALDRLQRSMSRLSAQEIAAWQREVQLERRASTRRRVLRPVPRPRQP